MRPAMVEAKISACRGSNAPGSIMPPLNTSCRIGSPALIDGAFSSTATRTCSKKKQNRTIRVGGGGGHGRTDKDVSTAVRALALYFANVLARNGRRNQSSFCVLSFRLLGL